MIQVNLRLSNEGSLKAEVGTFMKDRRIVLIDFLIDSFFILFVGEG